MNIMNNGISIITSFGCPFDCWFCIMKPHSLYNYKGNFDYNKLEEFLKEHKDTNEISISGGGDPLNEFDKHKDFYYDFLFPMQKKYNLCGIDVHTRIPLYDDEFWKKINRCVFSINFTNGNIVNEKFIRYVSKITKVRLFYCVVPETNVEDVRNLFELSNELNCQITIKQLKGHNDSGKFEEIGKEFPEIFKVYAKDYLIYYMPNNTITDTFMF